MSSTTSAEPRSQRTRLRRAPGSPGLGKFTLGIANAIDSPLAPRARRGRILRFRHPLVPGHENVAHHRPRSLPVWRIVDSQLATLLLHLAQRGVRLAAQPLAGVGIPTGDSRPADLEDREQVLPDGG